MSGCAVPASPLSSFRVVGGEHRPAALAAYRALRHRAFVDEQGLFARHDDDGFDAHPGTRVLLALHADGTVLGGVRLHPDGDDSSLGWWRGSRLVCRDLPGAARGTVGAALVHAACAGAKQAGALRFDAHVQDRHAAFFARLGWEDVRALDVVGAPHRLMRFPLARIRGLAEATKAPLGGLLSALLGGADAWRGDDGVPVAGSDVIACTDAILPGMVERDPEWAGWCGMLVTAHDLAAMGAAPVGALDALAAPDVAHAERVVRGLRDGAQRLDLPILGGHTQLGQAAALSVTGLGRTAAPIPAGAGRAGDVLTVTADLDGRWRHGYGRGQWDSSTDRSRAELHTMLSAVARARPRAAKDVSMAGVVGTIGMLAEAGGCGAEVDVAAVPRPIGVDAGDWLTCFPGFAMVTADAPGAAPLDAGPAVGAACGVLQERAGVRLRWPDGDVTTAIPGPVTGLGPTTPRPQEHDA
jgi:putative N-acetyltransferase (TIGR04045 family)